MSGYTSGPVREGAQAHIRALKAEDYVTDLLDEAQKRYGKVIFAYRRGSEFNISTDYGKGLFELLSEAYLDNVLLIVSGNPILGETLARELLGGLGALSPREATTSSRSSQRTGGTTQRSSKVFDFGPLNPPMTKTHVNKKFGPNHFLASNQDATRSAPSRIFSSASADPQKWMSNHMILQNLTKKDINGLRLLHRPHAMVVRTVEVVAILTGRAPLNHRLVLYSMLSPLVLTDDILTELLLLQQDMIPSADLRKARSLLKGIEPEVVRRINFAAGCMMDWAIAVTKNSYPSGTNEFKHAIFSRSKTPSASGVECIPINLLQRKAQSYQTLRGCVGNEILGAKPGAEKNRVLKERPSHALRTTSPKMRSTSPGNKFNLSGLPIGERSASTNPYKFPRARSQPEGIGIASY